MTSLIIGISTYMQQLTVVHKATPRKFTQVYIEVGMVFTFTVCVVNIFCACSWKKTEKENVSGESYTMDV